MSVLYAIILGIIQGITGFLPVGTLGHLCTVENLLEIQRETALLFETMLHLGTAAVIVVSMWKDVSRIGAELLEMLLDLIGNLNLYIHNRRTGDTLHYAKIVHGSYRRLAVMILVSSFPTMMIGYIARRLAAQAAMSPLVPGAGILITGIFLLVIDFSNAGGDRKPKDTGIDHAMWLGICQGLAVFPGFSREGLTVGTALLCGFGRKYAVKYSLLMSVPAAIGAFFVEAGQFADPSMTVGLGATYVLGMIVAGITGYFVLWFMVRLVQSVKFRYFAIYCFIAGTISLALNYL